jgi:hypothetical protein
MRIRRMSAWATSVALVTISTALPSATATTRSDVTMPAAAAAPTRSSAATRSTDDCAHPAVSDARGDARRIDLVSAQLTGNCDQWTVTAKLAKPLRPADLDVWTIGFNTDRRGTGCRGTDVLIRVSRRGNGVAGTAYAITRCPSGWWSEIGAVEVSQPDSRTLTTTIAGPVIGTDRFSWWTGVDAVGPNGFDALDQGRWQKAWAVPAMPRSLFVYVERDEVTARWREAPSVSRVRYTYSVTLTREGDVAPVASLTRRHGQFEQTFTDLEPGRYTLAVAAMNPLRSGRASTFTFVISSAVPA